MRNRKRNRIYGGKLAGSYGSGHAIVSITGGLSLIIVTEAPHGLEVGDVVRMTGTSFMLYNQFSTFGGTVFSVPSPTSFELPVFSSDNSVGGMWHYFCDA